MNKICCMSIDVTAVTGVKTDINFKRKSSKRSMFCVMGRASKLQSGIHEISKKTSWIYGRYVFKVCSGCFCFNDCDAVGFWKTQLDGVCIWRFCLFLGYNPFSRDNQKESSMTMSEMLGQASGMLVVGAMFLVFAAWYLWYDADLFFKKPLKKSSKRYSH